MKARRGGRSAVDAKKQARRLPPVTPPAPAPSPALTLTVTFDREEDGRWMAIIPELSGVMVHGDTREEARRRVHALALHVLADRLEAGELDELPALSLNDAA